MCRIVLVPKFCPKIFIVFLRKKLSLYFCYVHAACFCILYAYTLFISILYIGNPIRLLTFTSSYASYSSYPTLHIHTLHIKLSTASTIINPIHIHQINNHTPTSRSLTPPQSSINHITPLKKKPLSRLSPRNYLSTLKASHQSARKRHTAALNQKKKSTYTPASAFA